MIKAWFNFAMLAAESQTVMALRLMKLVRGGPAAASETKRMVSEKVGAATEAWSTALSGGGPDRVIRGYRRRVRKNMRRLTR